MSMYKATKTIRLPIWVPKDVKEHAKRLIENDGLREVEPLLIRLVSSPDMEKVWRRLSRATENPQKLIDFLEFVRLHRSLQGNPTDPIDIASDKAQRAAFLKVSKSAQDILNVLSQLTKSGHPEAGWCLLESALTNTQLREIDNPSKEVFLGIHEIQQRFEAIESNISIPAFIKTIDVASQLAATAPDSPLPVRRNSARAKTNQLVLDIKEWLKHRFYLESEDALIAAIVNTAFDSPDGGISADNVRKLLNPESEIEGDKAVNSQNQD